MHSFGLPTFRGGTHPPEKKDLAKDREVEVFPVPPLLAVSLSQGLGAPSKPVVAAGDRVLRGQLIAEPGGFVSAALHAPTSGTVKSIGECPHPVGLRANGIFIEPDGADEWHPEARAALSDDAVAALSPKDIVVKVGAAGIVGMGGAAFPTHVKLSPPPGKSIDTVILNGCECEPYLTADYRLMMDRPAEVIKGFRLLVRAVGAERGVIGVEANKPDAFERLLREVRGLEGLSVRLVAVKYPQGAEKQLIKALLGREVPSGGLPMDAGALVQNVGTAVAVYEAVQLGQPLTERLVTVSGECVENPGNLLCRIGTPISALLEARGVRAGARRLVSGGPMMGLAQWNAEVPVLKGTSGVLVLDEPAPPPHTACINCGRCVEGCPAHLMPNRLSNLGERGRFEDMMGWHVLDCIECGVCTYQCPAKRPIVHWIKQGKNELRLLKMKAEAEKKKKEAPEGVPAE
ncbi:MAG: electron transport complex subunit RsxC [Planctomycetota bacterium]